MRRSRALAALAAALLPGCMLFHAAGDIKDFEQTATIVGTLETPEPGSRAIVVGLFRDEDGKKTLATYYVRWGPGPFHFTVPDGRYHVFAFEDRNESLKYDEGEPAYYVGARQAPLAAAAGKKLDIGRIRLTTAVPAGVAELRTAAKRDLASSPEITRVQRGTITTWDDRRFRAEAGNQGMWTPLDAFEEYGAGVFFFEPYDPGRVPVVFVHGINGTAADFKTIIENLDRKRFQAWVFQYPSGFRLNLVSGFLVKALDELQLRYKFDRYVIVAHSMGGLVSRGAVNDIVQRGGRQPIALYLTISTPWDGHEAAEMGTKYSPVVLPVWLDMSPGSAYLAALFRKPLPDTLPYYLFFGYEGGKGTDGTVSLKSMLDLSAQDQSLRIVGFPAIHMSILQSPEVIDRLNGLLARYAAPGARTGKK
jgi:pimeloyl-ACP methyl ester carboxylesterase